MCEIHSERFIIEPGTRILVQVSQEAAQPLKEAMLATEPLS